jgi:phage baseplate assembly protein gpV
MINIGMEVWYVNTKPVGVTGVITDVFTYPGDVDTTVVVQYDDGDEIAYTKNAIVQKMKSKRMTVVYGGSAMSTIL